MSVGADPGHGHSIASWTSVIIMLVAFTIGTLAFWFNLPAVVWAAVVLLGIGALTGYILARMGYGVGGTRSKPSSHA